MKLAEIVRTRATSDETVETVRAARGALRQAPGGGGRHRDGVGLRGQPRVLRDDRGGPEGRHEGIATADEVDQLMMDCYRWPSGPFGMVKGAGSGWS